MVIDQTLLDTVNVAEGLGKEGILIVNTPNDPSSVASKTKFKGKCMTVDATKIALEAVGKNLPNTPMIGALIKATNCITLEAIEESIKHKFLKKLGEEKTMATVKSVDRAFNEVR
jgi:pyruvate ferredoxin oxidoreductase gamma subunit